jgi:hypothetical protein
MTLTSGRPQNEMDFISSSENHQKYNFNSFEKGIENTSSGWIV